jgi:Xaa-Pro aminopeptidase
MTVPSELVRKSQRLSRLCADAGVAGIVLATQANFAWITGGRSNRIDGSRELGAGSLLIAADGGRFIVANAIEMPRLAGEELTGLGFEPIEYPWAEEHAIADTVVRQARRVLGAGAVIGADWPMAGATVVDREIVSMRGTLEPEEVERYRALGRDVGAAVGDMCRTVTPGLEEVEVARRAADAVASTGARAIVTLVAADDRIARYRHPLATRARWSKLLMVVVCGQREGLIVSLTRLISAGPVDRDVDARTRATARVFAKMLDATQPGAKASEIFAATARAYAAEGFIGEEKLHHQGGATGYRSREWVAHPVSGEHVRPPQAFAWNPSITGTKVEETALVSDGGVELITTTDGWPAIPIDVRGRRLAAPGILEL